jgi:hypothetical protein
LQIWYDNERFKKISKVLFDSDKMSFKGEFSGARIENAKIYAIAREKHPKLFKLAEDILRSSAVEDDRLKKLVEKIDLEFPVKKTGLGSYCHKVSYNQNDGDKNSVWLRRENDGQIGLYFLEGENLCSPYLTDVSLKSGDLRIATTSLLPKSLERFEKRTEKKK